MLDTLDQRQASTEDRNRENATDEYRMAYAARLNIVNCIQYAQKKSGSLSIRIDEKSWTL